jgi:predicted NBD/HSP70 family sugar kinase
VATLERRRAGPHQNQLDGPHCRRGRTGCVETFVGASAVLDQWRGPDETRLGRETDGVEAVLSAWRNGDQAAQRAIDGVVRRLGLALSNLVNLYNPQKSSSAAGSPPSCRLRCRPPCVPHRPIPYAGGNGCRHPGPR